MRRMSRAGSLLLLGLLSASGYMVGLTHGDVSAVFYFGDSLLDVGNNNFLPGGGDCNFLPYGVDYIPASGRCSNGRIFPDFLNEYLGIFMPWPYLLHDSDTVVNGANFASAGAGALNSTDANSSIPLSQQLGYFEEFAQHSGFDVGNLSRALFVVCIGSNDYFYYFSRPLGSPLDYIGKVVSAITSAIQFLFSRGGRKFVVLNVPPLGCVPLTKYFTKSNGCKGLFNSIIGLHNAALNAAISGLSKRIPALITIIDINTAFSDIQNYLQEFGFKYSVGACCGAPPPTNGGVQCGTTLQIAGLGNVSTTLCSDRQSAFFWDEVHPTDHVVEVVSAIAWLGGNRYAQPFNISMLTWL